jgi:CheY-like chemotaxis protein
MQQCRLENKSVLIVDDTELQRSLLSDVLRKMGVNKIYEAKDGVDGVRAARFYKPDLILLDLTMPRMDGFEACSKIRLFADKATLPIIILTGQDRQTALEKIYALGANDFLDKPYNVDEISNRILFHLQFSENIKKLSHFEDFISTELETAKNMQQKIIPQLENFKDKLLPAGLDFYGFYQPSSGLGGDSWLVKFRQNNNPIFFMFDVAGHGINAAINNSFIISACNALFQPYRKGQKDEFAPAEFLQELNDILCDRMQGDTFCAGLCLAYDAENHMVDYAACALPPINILNKTTQELQTYSCNGLPMCITKEGFAPSSGQFPLSHDDYLFALTDGLIESFAANHNIEDIKKYGSMLPGERLLNECLKHIAKLEDKVTAQNVIEFIIVNFLDNHYDLSSDDVTLLSLTRL